MRRPANRSEWLVVTIGSALGLGLSPVAPGSLAALLGVGIHLCADFFRPEGAMMVLGVAFAVICALHFSLNACASRYWRNNDSGHFVLDEVAGYLLVAILAAPWVPTLWICTEGFLLFRVLDILKPPPARQIDQNMHNAWGVLLDDLVSAAYTAAILIFQMRILNPKAPLLP